MGVSSQWCRFSLLDDQGSIVAGGVVAGGAKPDLDTVNLIARLALMAKRTGTTFQLVDACPQLLDLLELAGLPVKVSVCQRKPSRLVDRGERAVQVEREPEGGE
jgi:hypothetical protein